MASPTDPDDASRDPEYEHDDLLDYIGRAVVPPVMHDKKRRKEMGLPDNDTDIGRYMVELNIQYRGGLRAAAAAFRELFRRVLPDAIEPEEISKSYFLCRMCCIDWRKLLKADEDAAKVEPNLRVIYKLWPDFTVKALIDQSVATVKADAAYRAYSASGAGIAWAIVDSGIDGTHPHFGSLSDPRESVLHHPDVADLHFDFTLEPDPPTESAQTREERTLAHRVKARAHALIDDAGHGTHVAGIVAGGLPDTARASAQPANGDGTSAPVRFEVFEQVFEPDAQGRRIRDGRKPAARTVRRPESLRGVAPSCHLVSLKVLGKNGEGRVSDVMRALVYIRDELNDDPKVLRVQGVNLSVGYDFDPQMFACGQSPLCVEVDRLVKSGVVVVVAAGNTGYGNITAEQRDTKVGLSHTINDPGNAALAITVGSTHRESPHTYGVSYFSSKGPTGDGRLKPDLVAPGERITSCASASKCTKLGISVADGVAAYVDDSGTSMAAPHVSGAVAAFLSIRREFIQRPEEVKRIFLQSATSLGRERYFEGHGLVDLMRAIQSV